MRSPRSVVRVNGATGILANPGFAGDISNSGTITVDENFTPTDSDNDGDLDGPFAQGNNRFGIRVAPGGTYTGNITNSGVITIESNNSAGIAFDSTLNGSFNGNNGRISVLGDNAVGLRTGAVPGHGKVDRSGSWLAGRDDAEPGIIMTAHPRVPQAYRQEYLKGAAEDTAWTVMRGGTLAGRAGTFRHILVSLEFTRLEPVVIDQKIYAPGIGIVLERAVHGPAEIARLVRVTG